MLPDKSIGCHRTFGSPKVRTCYDMVTKHGCQLWAHLEGTNKNTGEPVMKYACLDAMAHTLQLEIASVVREAAGEVSAQRQEHRAQATQAAANMAALNDNLIRMHSQTAQLAIAQVRALTAHDPDDAPRLIEHRT